eukprot:TRINITY_DN20848_c0_g2_i1.p1 TRINITY_DN20848_c0_g2~~TRINITY_DN20848_c0_g2_i1.p1  ORF type:complete len:317 (+),score=50.91 TRINITY_DN20848_c0_g2_i1:41-952(+)
MGPAARLVACVCVAAVSQAHFAAAWSNGPAGCSRRDLKSLRGRCGPAEVTGPASACEGACDDEFAASRLPWLRAALAACGALCVAFGAAVRPAHAESISVYFGQGCFWHVQNELANAEMKLLGRSGPEVTALAGYAGGTSAGAKGEVCYHNNRNAPDYGDMGHTEVVNVVIPEEKLGDLSKVLLDYAAKSTFGRHDPQDRGSEYRSAIGLPGGMGGSAFKLLEKASDPKLQFVQGEGGDADTLLTKKIWVYDTAKFPFYQGEIYHQFHDDMTDRYPDSYHELRKTAVQAGSLKRVACPDIKAA